MPTIEAANDSSFLDEPYDEAANNSSFSDEPYDETANEKTFSEKKFEIELDKIWKSNQDFFADFFD